jgi:hypothetical protein
VSRSGLLSILVAIFLAGCGPTYSSDDTKANTIAARSEARLYDLCATDDAGTCTPGNVRARAFIAYCANARELLVHRAPVPEAGAEVQCQPQ